MLEYGKSGIYNNNRLPAEKKKEEKEKENTRDRSVPDGSDKDLQHNFQKNEGWRLKAVWNFSENSSYLAM